MALRRRSNPEAVQAEDKAVDLYVLERALESTHTQQHLMEKVLEGYKVQSVVALDLPCDLALSV